MRTNRMSVMMIMTAFMMINATYGQSAGLNLSLGFPKGEFEQNVKRTGIGGSLEFLFWNPSKQLPFSFGVNLGYLNYGMESRRAPFSYTIPDVTVDVEHTNNITNLMLLFRLQTNNTLVRPYLDLLFGGSYFFTETTIKKDFSNEEVTSSNNLDDFTFTYGIGGGIQYNIWNPQEEEQAGPLLLDLKVRYLYGTEAEYMKEGSIKVNTSNGQVSYDVYRSKTDLLMSQLGVILYFNSFKDLADLSIK